MQPKKLLRRFWQIIKLFIIILSLTTAFFFFILFLSNLFSVKEFLITGDLKKEELVGVKNFVNRNIIFLTDEDIKNILLRENPQIKEINIKKIYPNKLEINIILNPPLVYFKTNNGYFVLSEDGLILYKVRQMSLILPLINYYQQFYFYSLSPGEKLSYRDILSALFFQKIFLNLGLHANTIDINGDNMIAFKMDNKTFLFTTEKELNKQQYELETLIKKFKIEGRDFKVLDLRFDKPTIKF